MECEGPSSTTWFVGAVATCRHKPGSASTNEARTDCWPRYACTTTWHHRPDMHKAIAGTRFATTAAHPARRCAAWRVRSRCVRWAATGGKGQRRPGPLTAVTCAQAIDMTTVPFGGIDPLTPFAEPGPGLIARMPTT